MWKSIALQYDKNDIIYPELSYSSYLGIISDPGWSCQNDVRDDYVLIYVTQGMLFCEQGDISLTLGAGEYIFLDKRIRHKYYFDKKIPSEIYWMHMNGKIVCELAEYINSLSPLPFTGRNPDIFEIIKWSISSSEVQSLDKLALSLNIVSALYTILNEISDSQKEDICSSEEKAFRRRVDEIIQNSDLGTITLNSFCGQMCMNKYYFSHQFKKYYSVSPMKYVNSVKIKKSKNLLQYSNMKIRTIAHECGFGSSTYFSTCFRAECGISPEEYRQRWQLSDTEL